MGSESRRTRQASTATAIEVVGKIAIANRQFESNIARVVTFAELQAAGPTGIPFADPIKLDPELREIFTRITHGDPSQAVQDGNFTGTHIPFTTPAAANTEIAVAHNLGVAPTGWDVKVPAKAGYQAVGSLYCTRDADATFLYLAVRNAADVGLKTSVRVWI